MRIEMSPEIDSQSLSLIDWSEVGEDVWAGCLEATLRFSHEGKRWSNRFADKSIVLLFLNPSLRTRCSMELAAGQLGAHVTTLQTDAGLWKLCFEDGVRMDGLEVEHVREAAGVLSAYYDAIGIRVFAGLTDYQQDRDDHMLRSFAASSTAPVVNMESAWAHPCQALADAGVLANRYPSGCNGKRFVLTWAYHPKALPMAVPNSTVQMAARMGFDVTVARPDGYALDPIVMETASILASNSGGSVEETTDLAGACEGANVVYAKAWAGPLHYEDPAAESDLRASHKNWCITSDLMDSTDGGKFMHCLPVRRNVVVTDDVLDGPNTLHIQQATFRIFAQKAILERCWGG